MPFKIDDKEFTFDTGLTEPVNGDSSSSADPIAGPGSINGDPSVKDTSGQDLTKATKLTLAQYLSDVTYGKPGKGSAPRPNDFPIDRNSVSSSELALETQAGVPSPLDNSSNSSRFAHDRNADGLNVKSSAYPTIRQLGLDNTKGKNSLTGNNLLPTWPSGPAVKIEDPAKPPSYVSRVLTTNRFTAGAREPTSDPVVGGDFGSTTGGTRVSTAQQATIGTTLSLRSTGTPKANDPRFDPLNAGSEALALVPSAVQLVVQKIDLGRLQASDLLAVGITSTGVSDDEMVSIAPNGRAPGAAGSWGQLNNTYNHFSGMAAEGMILLATAMTTAVLTALTALPLSLLSSVPTPPVPDKDALGRYSLGRYLKSAQSNALGAQLGMAVFGIQSTVYPLLRAATVGANAFFGNNVNGVPLSSITGPRSVSDPGFNVVFARAIIRSARTLIDRVNDSIKGNGLDIVRSSVQLIDYIKSSKLIGAINVFGQLGDAVLIALARDPQAFAGFALKEPPVDAVSGDRLNGSLKRAWANSTSPSLLLMPENLIADSLAGNVPAPNTVDAASSMRIIPLTQAAQATQGSRLSADDVSSFEDQLDGEYVPFYFHDLRTNEIISFHAFITALTDDYSVEWENVDGYGRVEPVKIYKGTQRRISLGFYIVSTSPTDFDEMWIKLNKLLTLAYPQFTKGKLVQTDSQATYRFVQPFSQLLGASPVIRLRLGDVLRSNYSKFALMRLFGYGDKELQLNSTKASYATGVDPGKLKAELARAINQPDASYTFYVAPGRYNVEQSVVSLLGDPDHALVFDTTSLKLSTSFVVSVSRPSFDGQSVVCTVKLNSDQSLTSGADTNMHGSEGSPIDSYEGGSYRIPISALKPTKQTIATIVQRLSSGDNTDSQQFLTEVTNFFDDSTNAVVKSFKSVAGKGLAGVIDTISFDWFDKIPWETAPDSRAPKMCRVTMGFSPIHDITPGLDHNGFNRSPVYPVGLLNRGK